MTAAPRPIALLDEPERLRVALSPLRRRLLDRLREPASATQLAGELAMGRQRINYHLRALEEAGLLSLVEERQRRGCTERILAARADAFVVDPGVMAADPEDRMDATSAHRAAQDTFAAEYLIDTAADVVRHVARMQTQAARQGTRLLTFTIDSEVSFATPADLERFTVAIADFVAREAAKTSAAPAAGTPSASGTTGTATGPRRYRIVIGAHPAPKKSVEKPSSSTGEAKHDRPRTRAHRDPHRRPH
jgi:DNA-binding transcriptional ArsR family regulator